MIVAVDVDGVVADLHTVWIEKYNIDHADSLSVSDIVRWEIHEFVKPECGLSIYDYLDDHDLYDNVLPIEGALQGVNAMREAGHRVIFATTATKGHAGRKFQWLVDHGFLAPGQRADYMEVTDKSLIRADVLIDDGLHNIQAFHGKAIVYKAAHNKSPHTWRDNLHELCDP